MIRNQAGQKMGVQITALDGSDFTGQATIYITLDAGVRAIGTVGSGLMTHEGGGYHTYSPTAAETDGALVAWQGTGSGAITAKNEVYTDSFAPTDSSGPSSGTYGYAPDFAEFIDEAFERCGKDPAKLTNSHLVSARRSINLMFADWDADDVRLFAVDEQTQALTASLGYYTLVAATLGLLTCFIRRDGVDTPVTRITREQYAQIPNKFQEGLPTQIFHNRKTGVAYLWSEPENSTDVLHYWRLRELQDVSTSAESPDVPKRAYEALASGLAARLALKFAPDRHDKLMTQADTAFKRMKEGDRERADVTFGINFR